MTPDPARAPIRSAAPVSRRLSAFAWPAVCALLAAGALAGSLVPAAAIDWQPARAWSQPWRWWTAAFVHLSGLHLGANLAGTLVVAALGWSAALPLRASLAWLLAWPATHLALGAAAPGLHHYGGLSGVLHAGVAVVGVHLVTVPHGDGPAAAPARSRRRIGIAVLAVLALKVLLEEPWGPPARAVEGWDIPVAPIAHACGVVAGTLAMAVAEARARWR